MKTRIRLKEAIYQEPSTEAGMEGYIDGYIRGGNGVPYAVVIIDDEGADTPKMCPLYKLEVIKPSLG